MPTQVSTQSSLSAEAKTFYDRTLLERAKPFLVHAQFGQPRPLSRRNGKTIEFRKFSALTPATTPLTEGVTPAGNSLTVTAITATIAQYGDFVEGSDIVELTSIDPILTETAQLLGEQSGQTVDVIARDVLTAGTNVQYANAKTSRLTVAAGDNLSVLEIRKAVRTLEKNNARRIGDSYIGVIGPSAKFDIQSDPKWEEPSKYAGSTQIFAGEVGRIFGVRFVETTQAKVFAAAGAGTPAIDVHATMVLGQNAYGQIPLEGAELEFIYKDLGSSGTADPLNQRWTSSWKMSQAYKILNDLAMVRIEHAVSG